MRRTCHSYVQGIRISSSHRTAAPEGTLVTIPSPLSPLPLQNRKQISEANSDLSQGTDCFIWTAAKGNSYAYCRQFSLGVGAKIRTLPFI